MPPEGWQGIKLQVLDLSVRHVLFPELEQLVRKENLSSRKSRSEKVMVPGYLYVISLQVNRGR